MSKCFESLSNELMYEIFDYIDGLELYQAFYNLNSRINKILSCLLNIHFESSFSTNDDDSLIELFGRRVAYLKVFRPDDINVTRFSNVRVLEFYDCLSQHQLLQIRHACFTHLVHFRMCYIEDSDIASAFFQKIFSNGFPSLSKCVLDELTPPHVNYPWSSSPSLRTLIIGGLALPVYSIILSTCLNLTYLHWSAIRYTESDIKSVPIQQSHLKRLYIQTINIQYIETILSHIPNLKRLHIVSDWSRGNNCRPLDFKQLAHVLLRYVPSLQYFDCETMERNPNDIDIIHRFHSCFRQIQYEIVPDGRTRFFTKN